MADIYRQKNLPTSRPGGGSFPHHTLVPDQALRDLHPGLHGNLKGGTPALGDRVDLALASLDDLRVGCHVASLFKFPEYRIDRALGRRTTTVCGALHRARDFVAMHRPRLQHTQNEKLGEAHFDETIPIRAVGIIHGLSARCLGLCCGLCHAGNHIPRWAMCQGSVANVDTTLHEMTRPHGDERPGPVAFPASPCLRVSVRCGAVLTAYRLFRHALTGCVPLAY